MDRDEQAYAAQLAAKTERFTRLFAGLDTPPLEVFASPESHFRMRAEFRIWHEGGRIDYAMFEPGRKAGTASLIKIRTFQTASRAINELMPALLAALSADDVLKNRLYQCEFLGTQSGEMLVSLIYHKKLDDAWTAAACRLAQAFDIHLIGRSKGQKIVLSQDFVTEEMSVGGRLYRYRQTEGGFTQPNAAVCGKMLAWAADCAGSDPRDLLELYCGNGNFTFPLAACFRRVLATEISKTSAAAAQWGIEANGIGNIRIARLSAEEFTEAYQGRRTFRRLAEQGIDLAAYDFSTVFVDPPRAGVDGDTLRLLAGFDRILYISCNPDTLRANLDVLAQSHRIRRMALFDQFPFTHHIESGVLLEKRV
ncbi:tRNA (uridine(54)-C5)-methyltransferase TrmA [Neisseria leonii]|uniref:tRNA (uridine(54)-C5)-methyltransferase TrmA n=1 Tax=Neisseria leonii TaxID=2995413 RepID=UPI00237BD09D|nr:tRNA (uridine(54)-C5)-methyltransferase TrmA [Neisseria sp. 3986]MDD9324851.1 tRNA (uridine(54)-C5)-methyltransferase TrmA [Neisseria sp. 3986]